MIQGINNPLLSLGTPYTDLRTGLTDNGQLVPYGGIYLQFRANAAITAGQALSWVVPTTGVNGTGNPLSVKPVAASAADPIWMFAGIAVNGAAAGALVNVCLFGHCRALVAAGTTAVIGDRVILDVTNAGVVDRSTSALAAADVNGNSLGVVLGAKDATNTISIWLHVK